MKKLYVQEIIDYIEDHITDEINIDTISSYIGYSKFYLNRFFSIFTGMSIMYYVKKRKLEYAIVDLQTKEDIIDIAFKYAFQSRRSFSRLFTSFYGKSPSNYRDHKLELTPKLNLTNIGGIKMLPYLSEPFTKDLKELYVLSQTVCSTNPEEEVITLQTKFKNTNQLVPLLEVGFDIPVSEENQNEGIRGYEYWLCLKKDEYESIQDNTVTKKIIPSSTYIALSIQDPFSNPFERIPNGWKKLSAYAVDNCEFNDKVGNCGLEHVEEIEGFWHSRETLKVLE